MWAVESFFYLKREIPRPVACLDARVSVRLLAMEPVTVGLLVMGISTASITRANSAEAAQPLLDQPQVISVERPSKDKPSYFEVGRLHW
jgi:hypothetical protein|tara:strand:+ start:1030 stop:1296 length:267 start_codon:yes stop_codon:yes gene_type:complete